MLSGRPAPEPRLEGLTVGLLRRAPELGDGRATESSDAADEWAGELERLGARVVEAAIPPAKADMWPLFLHEAAHSHRATFPARAAEYGPVMRPKLEAAVRGRAGRRSRPPTTRSNDWRRYQPDVDLYVSPCIAIELPPEDATSSRCGCRSRRSCAGST